MVQESLSDKAEAGRCSEAQRSANEGENKLEFVSDDIFRFFNVSLFDAKVSVIACTAHSLPSSVKSECADPCSVLTSMTNRATLVF